MSKPRRLLSIRTRIIAAILMGVPAFSTLAQPAPVLEAEVVASGLNLPVFATAPLRDTARLFVVQLSGQIRIVKNDTLLTQPFLDIDPLACDSSENGLLGLAFDPDYATNGYFYVKYNNLNCDLQISRFQVSATNRDSADPSSEQSVLFIDQPEFPNHNGGSLLFSPIDGYLYIPTGDGTCCGDPFGTAQDPEELRGKVLRLDLSGGLPYTVPASNPFVGSVDTLPEIWSFGLRNPYRSSFDRLTGDLYIADVGQDIWEEFSFQPASSTGGNNYGWPTMEGFQCYSPPFGCDTTGLQKPIYNYQHIDFNCSITGGFVYRGCGVPELYGRYFFGDFCTGRIWSVRHDGTSVTDFASHESEISLGFGSLLGFGEDATGELYICAANGDLLRIKKQGEPLAECGCCIRPMSGNVDYDALDQIDIADLTFLVDHLFINNPPLPCPDEANVDGSPQIDIADLTTLVDYLFGSEQPPTDCP